MTKDELVARLVKLKAEEDRTGGSAEADAEADELLIEYIGDEDVKNAFEDLTKWYE